MTQTNTSERTLILGAGRFARLLAREIQARPQSGYRLVGMVSEHEADVQDLPVCPVVGSVDNLLDILSEIRPARIIATLAERDAYLPAHKLVEAKFCRNIVVEDGESVYERLTGKVAIEALTPGSVIFSGDYQPGRGRQAAARVLSLVFALAGLVLLAPVLALVAIAIKLDSRGPVLFVQERVGLDCRRFKLLKFRTMRPSHQQVSEWAGDNQHRITRVGRILRKFRLDELPQFINVLRGDMNIVGPRPHPASNYELFTLVSRNTPECGGQIPYYSLRSMVRPGITGWAQVRYQYANNLNEEIEKLRFDLYYVKHFSLWLDLQIIWETIAVVVLGRESQQVQTAPQAEHKPDEAAGLNQAPATPSPVYSTRHRSATAPISDKY